MRHDFYDFFDNSPRTNGCEFADKTAGGERNNRPIRMLGLSNSMAAEAEVQFVTRTRRFLLDPDFQAPVSVDLRPRLATKWAFLKAWINGSLAPHDAAHGVAGSAQASSTTGIVDGVGELATEAPLPPSDPRTIVKDALMNVTQMFFIA